MLRLMGVSLVGMLIIGQIAWIGLRDLKHAKYRTPVSASSTSAQVPAEDTEDRSNLAQRSIAVMQKLRGHTSTRDSISGKSTKSSKSQKESSVSNEQRVRETAPEQLVELVKETVVQVSLPGSSSTGTGYISALREDGFDVVTAAHVLKGDRRSSVGPSIEVTSFFASDGQLSDGGRALDVDARGRVHRMVWLAGQSREQDVALLRIVSRERPKHVLALASSALPTAPFDAWQVRWTSREVPAISQASVLREQTVQRDPKSRESKFLICAPASERGMSGGPLVMADGSVLGIASGNSSGESYYVPREYIADMQARILASEGRYRHASQ